MAGKDFWRDRKTRFMNAKGKMCFQSKQLKNRKKSRKENLTEGTLKVERVR